MRRILALSALLSLAAADCSAATTFTTVFGNCCCKEENSNTIVNAPKNCTPGKCAKKEGNKCVIVPK